MEVKNLKLPARFDSWLKAPILTQNIGKFLCLAIVGVILAITIPQRLSIPYYHMIDEQDYQAFIWIKNNTNPDYEKAMLDPWKATAFTALTGKHVYSRLHTLPEETDEKAYSFIRNGSRDTTMLKENGISVIYTRLYDLTQDKNIEFNSDNPDLVEVARNIYLLKSARKTE
jgi:hypothetical protein